MARGSRESLEAVGYITALGVLSAVVALCLLNPPGVQHEELVQSNAHESMLHLLTPRERELFRAQRANKHGLTPNMLASWTAYAREHPQKQVRSSRAAISDRPSSSSQPVTSQLPFAAAQQQHSHAQTLGAWPYRHPDSAAQLDHLGQAIHDSNPEEREEIKKYILNALNSQHQGDVAGEDGEDGQEHYSEENPPCYTPEDCEQRARTNGYFGQKESKLPIYDDDTAEFLAAMQKQDKMILAHKKDKERRDAMGSEAPKLPAVTCGEQCFAARAVWCCRLHQHAIPPA